MAIARNANSNATGVTSGTTLTWSHTCSGSDRILIATFFSENSKTISGVTYNGISMTQANTNTPVAGIRVYNYYLVAPATGANNIVATFASGSGLVYGIAESYTGAKQTGQPDAIGNTGSASATSLSVNITTVAANSWIVGGVYGGNSAGFAGTGSWSVLFWGTGGATDPAGWNGFAMLDTNGPIVTPASTAVGMSMTGGANQMGLVGMSIAPAPESGPANLKSLDGNVKANIKSYNGNVIANIKSISGNA